MAESESHKPLPALSCWVVRFADRIPAGGPVLDLACGGGRHGRFFLARGHPATFLDRDTSGVADLADTPKAEIVTADLEGEGDWPLDGRRFAGVVVTNYLWRPILPRIIESVAPGGLLLYETFAVGNEAFGRPRNPDFLLRADELLDAVRGRLTVLAYEQCREDVPTPRIVQHIAARRP